MSLRKSVAGVHRRVRRTLLDAAINRRLATARKRFLVVRDPQKFEIAYERGYLAWLEQNFPSVRARFELQLLPGRIRDASQYILHVPWLQDPVQKWSERAYEQANRLAEKFDRRGVAVINRVDRLVNAAKVEGSERIRTSGLRTPRMVHIDDVDAFRSEGLGLKLPFIVRQDWGHGKHIRLIESRAQLEDLDLSEFERPIAVEFIDVRSPEDHLVRKYRYVVAGDIGLPLSMHICKSWKTRGRNHLVRNHLIEEERAYADAPVEHAAQFVRAAKALELDFVAFDYGIDHAGRPAVWEANPYPSIKLSTGRGVYRAPAVVRAYAALTRTYLRAAGLEVPSKVDRILSHHSVHSD